MSKKQAAIKASNKTNKITKALVIFGIDEHGKPRAARFTDDNEHLVARAAQALGLRIGIATKPKHFEVVGKLPIGRIHATGPAAVPIIPKEVYDAIAALVGGEPSPISTSFAKSWDELGPGHLVIAQETLADGWFEAVITKRAGDSFTLKWRDYLSMPEFERPITAIALLTAKRA
jgi:hypothetical protein